MKRIFLATIIAVLTATGAAWAAPPLPLTTTTGTYLVYNQWGGTWQDANKTAANTEDDLMCWAAAASNVLAWGRWTTAAFNTTDKIFTEFQDHWTDNVGWADVAWKWWLNGTTVSPSSRYSYVDVPGSGNFFPGTPFNNYYAFLWDDNIMPEIDAYLHQGYGVTMSIYRAGSSVGHVVTAWGFVYEMINNQKVYKSIYITDSDDGYLGLKNYSLTWKDNSWFLGGGYSGWFINTADAFLYNPANAGHVPIPGSALLLTTGLAFIGLWYTKQ